MHGLPKYGQGRGMVYHHRYVHCCRVRNQQTISCAMIMWYYGTAKRRFVSRGEIPNRLTCRPRVSYNNFRIKEGGVRIIKSYMKLKDDLASRRLMSISFKLNIRRAKRINLIVHIRRRGSLILKYRTIHRISHNYNLTGPTFRVYSHSHFRDGQFLGIVGGSLIMLQIYYVSPFQ